MRSTTCVAWRNWVGCGDYGFYESADFGAGSELRADDPLLVKAWMAHHQGMILLSIGNFLCGNIVQQWFHGDAQVRATELLLHERPVVHHVRPVSTLVYLHGRPAREETATNLP